MYTAVYKFGDYWDPEKEHSQIIIKQGPWSVIQTPPGTRWMYLIYNLNNKYACIANCNPDVWIKKYKENINTWINSVREKDIKKIKNLNNIINQIKADINTIKSVWKKSK